MSNPLIPDLPHSERAQQIAEIITVWCRPDQNPDRREWLKLMCTAHGAALYAGRGREDGAFFDALSNIACTHMMAAIKK